MTVLNPPGFLQNAGATHTAEQFRNWSSILTGGKVSTTSLIPRGGVKPDSGNALQVTQSGSPGMSVVVRSGHAVIPGSQGSTQGAYFVANDADVTLTITTAHASLGRIDSVVFQVEDAAFSGAANTSSLVVVAGTPSGSPAAPTLPNNSIELARVTVAALDTSITTGDITDRRHYLASVGGQITCTSTTRPAANTVTDGQEIYETDTDRKYITHDAGTTWTLQPTWYIARQTLVAPAATVTFSSIPTNLRSLRIQATTRFDAGGGASLYLRINGNSTAANYHSHNYGANGTADVTPVSNAGTVGALEIGVVPGNNNAGEYGVTEALLYGWDAPHSSHLGCVFMSNAIVVGVGAFSRNGGGEYLPAGPYTSLVLLSGTGNFDTGCAFSIIGDYT